MFFKRLQTLLVLAYCDLLVSGFVMGDKMMNWPHAPPHKLLHKGTYMVTGATYKKINHFQSAESLDFLCNLLVQVSMEYQWNLQAWVVFANHYHFIAHSDDPVTLSMLISKFHSTTARYINKKDNMPSRKIWWQYWDSYITYPHSYFARLNYVHQNPVKHGLEMNALDYRWSSINWFKEKTSNPLYKTISSFKTNSLSNIIDDF